MSFANPIIQAGVAGLSRLFADRAVTPVEACEAYLSRIAGLDGALGAYVAVDAEGARAAAHASAERLSRGAPLSPVDGVPVAVKANIAVEGLPWHAGIGAYRGRKAEADAACVARLKEAGAVILGLVNMSEGAFGGPMDTPWFGKTQNPWLHDYIPGSSSGGSAAATAAGLCAGALGTDTLGSVRIPSSLCGVFGHKPTAGLVPVDGVVPLSWTLDNVGVHGRSAQDCAQLLGAASGAAAELVQDIVEPAGLELLKEAPLAVLEWEGVEVEPEVRQALQATVEAARAAGLTVEPLRLQGYDFADRANLFLICAAEASVAHAEALARDPQGFSSLLRERLAPGAERSAADLAAAYRDLAEAGESVRGQLTPYAALLLPATRLAATPYSEGYPAITQFTALGNVLGLPATVFPTGLDPRGRPLAAQALAWEDDVALGLAALLGRDLGGPPAFQG